MPFVISADRVSGWSIDLLEIKQLIRLVSKIMFTYKKKDQWGQITKTRVSTVDVPEAGCQGQGFVFLSVHPSNEPVCPLGAGEGLQSTREWL